MEKIEGQLYAYSDKDIKLFLTKQERKKFYQWMSGQTGPVLKDGTCGYFRHDVERFIKLIRAKVPTYFD